MILTACVLIAAGLSWADNKKGAMDAIAIMMAATGLGFIIYHFVMQ